MAMWRQLASASEDPLRWAYHRDPGGPVLLLGEQALFATPDGAFVLVDARTGALRWQSAPAGRVRWHALAASPSFALAIGADPDNTAWIRLLDLASGASVDRRTTPRKRHALAVGPALAVSDGCELELVGPGGATLHTVHGRTLPDPDVGPICVEAAQLVAADATTASLVGWVGEQPRIDRVDRRSGALVDTLALEPGASARREPHTGLLLVTTTTGSVRAIRLGDSRPVSRTWAREAVAPLDVRGVALADGRTLLLVREGRRSTAFDPNTLTALWSSSSAGPVAILGETMAADATAALLTRPGEIHWLDPDTGATLARRARPSARSFTLHGELALVGGSGATLALDSRSGATRWAILANVHGAPGAHLGLTGPGSAGETDVVEAASGIQRLHVRLRATLLGRIPRVDGDLSLLVVARPAVLAAFADADETALRLGSDPFVALAPACDAARLATPELLESLHRCHTGDVHEVLFAEQDPALSAKALAVLDHLARAWRRNALADPTTREFWPTLLVRGRRSASEAPELADRRAEAVRDALLAHGVPCSQILAAGMPDMSGRRVEITWLDPLACIL
ncbi:MAG: PQQ-binding-like beta-propeller repeat protein [Nannocystis sp.]|nr:PQQ-binding-like beta-propeller repeat protein [Nannocystis sp.]MBA3548377.1 PQQ-binding-like beta-propeller repeat protein [Nannocystis sp.]